MWIAEVFARAGPVDVLGVMIEQSADRHHREAEQKVKRNEVGIELRVDHDGTEQSVGEDTQHERAGEKNEVAATLFAKERREKGGAYDDNERPRHHPVGVLDKWVNAHRTADSTLEACRPVGTSQP